MKKAIFTTVIMTLVVYLIFGVVNSGHEDVTYVDFEDSVEITVSVSEVSFEDGAKIIVPVTEITMVPLEVEAKSSKFADNSKNSKKSI